MRFEAADGVELGGFLWRRAGPDADRPIVVVSAATSVRCRYYARFAAHLHHHGFDVLTFDYRGVGQSRPARLRGFRAGWREWGELDLDAALGHAMALGPGRPVHVVGHSFGGVAIGLAPRARAVRRIVTVGAQYAYWRDYAAGERAAMVRRWHAAMPALALALGYVPARRLGWMEDTPRGVALDWARMGPRIERRLDPAGASDLPGRFAEVTAPILAISLTDDPFGTPAAIERALGYFSRSPRAHLRVAPEDAGAAAIGHFAFFHDRFRDRLWPLALGFLQDGRLPDGHPGAVAARFAPSA
ncbi:hypothetical protein GCM10008171_28220 [Methylopila jiangsuensis]|uniref:Serine aminopeptidase S33 domain-containing protein n=1 Tax=Methylopila jiangsuensis TaxID=586230 RepID=A0A9W6JJX8_9HYPH|nr:alpha/beta fold hydrolase [Methylopila jiangsuensis]MDR6285043.1 putative alpha/beta hydrolase [Methylopila jiangsuensis]GLK77568.1 hypothetical protein GCM10008171_28220 [Methylopila jiangsuensis]